MLEKVGTAGHVAGYDVLILADAVTAANGVEYRRFPVPSTGTATAEPPSCSTDRRYP